jgi:hypothetical protein
MVKPENIVLPTPLSVPPPEGKPWWIVVVGVLVVGLLVGMVGMTVASGSRTFLGAGAIFPIFMIGGVGMMMFGGRFGGQQQMSRPKLDAMRAQFMLMLDMLRETAQESADSMDHNYRWFHPAPGTLAAASSVATRASSTTCPRCCRCWSSRGTRWWASATTC